MDPNYGNCYTFNADGEHKVAPRAGATTGKAFSSSADWYLSCHTVGLAVTYYVGEEEYLDYIEKTGVKVVVHTQHEPVFPDIMGVNVASGYQSQAGMTKVSIAWYTVPYCTGLIFS